MVWQACQCSKVKKTPAKQNMPICHKSRLWQAYRILTDRDRHDNAPSGYWLAVPSPSLSSFPPPPHPHSWLLVRAEESRNPQSHRRKSLLEHLLISTKSQTRARERSPGIRLCSNSKVLSNSPDKPPLKLNLFWLCSELRLPSSKSCWGLTDTRYGHMHAIQTHKPAQLQTFINK